MLASYLQWPCYAYLALGGDRGKYLSQEMVLHPPTPSTLSPLLKGGEDRGEGGSYNHVPCPFGALLVTLCRI